MARKYTRDNRGRFASSGGGATARGGRLKTAGGNKRATQTMRAQGAGGAGVMKGRAARTVAGESVMRKLPKAAPKAVTPKAAPNAAKQRYKQASSTARAVGRDLRGASPMERRTANSKAAVVRNMERNRSTATASAANSPKAAQKARETARAKRAQSQFSAGMARESEGPGSKASRKVTVARRAMQIYSGKVDPKAKATARLTRTTDQYKLQDRIRRSAKLKPPKSPKPAAPAQAKAVPKAAPKVKLGAEPDKARMLRNMTNPGIRQSYASQGGKAMSPLDAKKVARSQATAEAARKFYGTSSRDRPKPAAPAQAKAAPKARGIDDSKVSRVIGRVNGVVRGAEQKSGVKRLNATQVGVRAKSFLARKEGGSVGMLNQKSQPEAFASVRKAMTKPPKYSTQTPNRNKPGRFNDLGQDKARAKAKLEARTARDRIRDGNAAAKAKSDKAKPSRLLGRREIYGGTMGAPGDAKGPRIKGTIAKPKAPKAAPSSEVARTRKQAGSYQRARTKGRLEQVKLSQAWANKGKSSTSKPFYVGKQLKRSDTGMRQLSLTGGSKTLYKFKRK